MRKKLKWQEKHEMGLNIGLSRAQSDQVLKWCANFAAKHIKGQRGALDEIGVKIWNSDLNDAQCLMAVILITRYIEDTCTFMDFNQYQENDG